MKLKPAWKPQRKARGERFELGARSPFLFVLVRDDTYGNRVAKAYAAAIKRHGHPFVRATDKGKYAADEIPVEIMVTDLREMQLVNGTLYTPGRAVISNFGNFFVDGRDPAKVLDAPELIESTFQMLRSLKAYTDREREDPSAGTELRRELAKIVEQKSN